MFRSFVYVLGLAVTLAGCGDSSGGSAGTGGTGGIGGEAGTGGAGGTGGLSGDACLDDIDILAEIEDIRSFVTEQCLALEGRGCALMQVAPCVAECLEEEVGLPQDCGLCIGFVSECILRECISDCTDPDSTDCGDCVSAVSAQCDEVFEPCAGFVAP